MLDGPATRGSRTIDSTGQHLDFLTKSTHGLKCKQGLHSVFKFMLCFTWGNVDAHQGLCLPLMFWIMPAAVMSGVSVSQIEEVLSCGGTDIITITSTCKYKDSMLGIG